MLNETMRHTTRLAALVLLGLLPMTAALSSSGCGKKEPPPPAEKKVAKKEKKAEKKEGAAAAKGNDAEKGDSAEKAANSGKPWPNGARLVVSISMQFESGGQPEGAESPFSGSPVPKAMPDLAAESWFRYGATEGIGRLLTLWDKHNVKVTSHIVGEAAEKYPEVAKEIAERGHEIAAHGMSWEPQSNKSYADELKFVKDGVDAVEKVTGQHAVGYNASWLRRSKNTLKVLQELGFLYAVDDVSRDEPFITTVKGKNFVIIPYTVRNNDLVAIEGRHHTPAQFLSQLKNEVDQLYAEGAKRRRMMSISLHDRIGGTPAMTRAMDQFLEHAKKKSGVVFMRKDEIAKLIQDDPKTVKDESESAHNAE
jgi:peptidoglycan/xylan/chitin deacetylase (PgdA/CDA1 family)